MTAPIVLREALTEADWEAVQAVRTRVFIDEQGVMPDDEWDIADAPSARGLSTHHVLAVRDGTPVGVARWRAVGDAVKLERFAVVPEARGQGLARRLVAHTLDAARKAGHRRFVVHAQTAVIRLYAAFGFRAEGEVFDEAGIDHVKMTLETS